MPRYQNMTVFKNYFNFVDICLCQRSVDIWLFWAKFPKQLYSRLWYQSVTVFVHEIANGIFKSPIDYTGDFFIQSLNEPVIFNNLFCISYCSGLNVHHSYVKFCLLSFVLTFQVFKTSLFFFKYKPSHCAIHLDIFFYL